MVLNSVITKLPRAVIWKILLVSFASILVVNVIVMRYVFFKDTPRAFFEGTKVAVVGDKHYRQCFPKHKLLELSHPDSAFLIDVYKYYPGDQIVILALSYHYVDKSTPKTRPPYKLPITYVRSEYFESEDGICFLNDCDIYEEDCLHNVYRCDIPSKFKTLTHFHIQFPYNRKEGMAYLVQDCTDLPSYEKTALTVVGNDRRLIHEWIEYHQFLGFDHLYIYCVKNDDKTCSYIDQNFGKLTTTFLVPHLPYNQGSQFFAMQDAAYRFRRNSWIMIHDIDEYPVFFPTLDDFLVPYTTVHSNISTLQLRNLMYDSTIVNGPVTNFPASHPPDFQPLFQFHLLDRFTKFSAVTGVVEWRSFRYEEQRSKVVIRPVKSYYGGVHMYCSDAGYRTQSVGMDEGYINHFWGKEGKSGRTLKFPFDEQGREGQDWEARVSEKFDYFLLVENDVKDLIVDISKRYVEIITTSLHSQDKERKTEKELGDKRLMDLKRKYVQRVKAGGVREVGGNVKRREFTCPRKYCGYETEGEYVPYLFESRRKP